MTRETAIVLLLGRVAMLPLFGLSGVVKLLHPQATIGEIATTGFPLPAVAYVGATFIETVVIVMFVVGGRTRTMASVLLAYCVATALLFHLNFRDQPALVNLLKNFAIAGGLAQIAALGGGRYSLDHVLAQRDESEGRQ